MNNKAIFGLFTIAVLIIASVFRAFTFGAGDFEGNFYNIMGTLVVSGLILWLVVLR